MPGANEEIRTVAVLPTFDMMLFGGTGDLVTRKLLPALYRRYAAGQVSEESRIVGIARGALSRAEYAAQAQAACREFLGKEFDSGRWERFCRLLHYLRINAAAEADYAQLTRLLEGRDRDLVAIEYFRQVIHKSGGGLLGADHAGGAAGRSCHR